MTKVTNPEHCYRYTQVDISGTSMLRCMSSIYLVILNQYSMTLFVQQSESILSRICTHVFVATCLNYGTGGGRGGQGTRWPCSQRTTGEQWSINGTLSPWLYTYFIVFDDGMTYVVALCIHLSYMCMRLQHCLATNDI